MKTSTQLIDLIEKGIADSYSYQEYRALVSQLLLDNKSTGNEQSEALTNYSMLNDRRMKRLDKTIKIDATIVQKFKAATTNITWV